jgi:hypothetical protein
MLVQVIGDLERQKGDISILMYLQNQSPRQVGTAMQTVDRLVRSLRPDQSTRSIPKAFPSKQECQHVLITRLHTAFRQYGPLRVRNDVIDHAIAAILVQFGIEEDQELSTIANRYRQRRTRPRKTPASTLLESLYASLAQGFPPAATS